MKSDADDYRYFPEPDLLPIEPPTALVSALRAALPEAPAVRRRRLRETWGFTELEFRDVANAGLLVEIEETVAAGAAGRRLASGGRVRSRASRTLLPSTLRRSRLRCTCRSSPRSSSQELTDRLASQVLEGVIAGEGRPSEVVAARGLAVVSDDGALLAAIDEALAEQPDVLEKLRDGKVQAAGTIIGALMKGDGWVCRCCPCSGTRVGAGRSAITQ